LGMFVMPNQMPYSSVKDLMSESGEIVDQATLNAISQHANEFIDF